MTISNLLCCVFVYSFRLSSQKQFSTKQKTSGFSQNEFEILRLSVLETDPNNTKQQQNPFFDIKSP